MSSHSAHRVTVVILTTGDRPQQLARAIASVRRQRSSFYRLVLVANGVDMGRRPDGVDRVIVVPENVGVPAGRNLGASAAADNDLILFLDDDAELLDTTTLHFAIDRFESVPELGVMALRIVDQNGCTARRHVPRIGGRSAARSGYVTAFLGGACLMRKSAFDSVQGYDERFFYAMEETDLAWRLIDHGWSIWYAADHEVFHPATQPSRHPGQVTLTARNRLWAAWRSLPCPFLLAYMFSWTVISMVRRQPVRSIVRGYQQGWRERPRRAPLRWRTIYRLTTLGRPPFV